MDRVRKARKPTEIYVPHIAAKHYSFSVFPPAAIISFRHRVHIFLLMKKVEMLRRICWYRHALDFARGMFSGLSNNLVPKKAATCASSGLGISFFKAKKPELMNGDFAVLPGWTNASALPKEFLKQLNAPSGFSTKILLEQFYFFQSTSPAGEDLRAEE